MFETITPQRNALEMAAYNNLVSFLLTYGIIVAIAIVTLFLFQQFNKLLNIKIRDILVVLAVLFVLDYLFGIGTLTFVRGVILKSLKK